MSGLVVLDNGDFRCAKPFPTCHVRVTQLHMARTRILAMNITVGLSALAVVLAATFGAAAMRAEVIKAPKGDASAAVAAVTPPALLEFREVASFREGSLQLSEKVKRLDGQRVRMTGYMAHLELPPKGGFYLAPILVHGDESGAGTADLPLESVLVVSRSAGAAPVDPLDCPVEVVGTLAVGHAEDSEGHSSWLRITLD